MHTVRNPKAPEKSIGKRPLPIRINNNKTTALEKTTTEATWGIGGFINSNFRPTFLCCENTNTVQLTCSPTLCNGSSERERKR